jgi:hypothetical protein
MNKKDRVMINIEVKYRLMLFVRLFNQLLQPKMIHKDFSKILRLKKE